MKKKTLLLIVILVLVGGTYASYKYLYRDHRNIAEEEASSRWNALRLRKELKENPANNLLNSTVEVSGTVTQIEETAIILSNAVYVSLKEVKRQLKIEDEITVKGRCVGYDDLFEMANLDQSIVIDTE